MRICVIILMITYSAFAGTEVESVLRELVEKGFHIDAKTAGFVEAAPGEGQKLLLKHANFPKSPKFKKYWEHAPHNKDKWQGLNPWNKDRIAEAFLKTDMAQAFYSDLKKAVTMDCRMGMEKKKEHRGWSTKIAMHSQRTYSMFLFDQSVCLSRIGRYEEALDCNLTALRLFKRNNVDSFDIYPALDYQGMLKLHRPQILKLILQINDSKQLKDIADELNTHHIRALNHRSIQNLLFESMVLGKELDKTVRSEGSSYLVSSIAVRSIMMSSYNDDRESLEKKLTMMHASGELDKWIDKEHAQALKQLLVLEQAADPGKHYQQVQRLLLQIPKSYFGDSRLWASFIVRDFELQAEIDVLCLLVACQIYHMNHGQFADNLEMLKKDMPKLATTDPFSGKNYGYKVSAELIIISSVGPDGKTGVDKAGKKSDDIAVSLEFKK